MASASTSTSSASPEKSSIITWMDFENDRVLQCSANPHLKNAKKFTDMSLYGDAELTIYMSPSQLWTDSLVKFAEFVKAAKGTGWIRSSSRSPAVDGPSTKLTSILERCAHGWTDFKPDSATLQTEAEQYIADHCGGCIWNMWLPEGESEVSLEQSIVLRDDGNFRMVACKSAKFWYLICFATS